MYAPFPKNTYRLTFLSASLEQFLRPEMLSPEFKS